MDAPFRAGGLASGLDTNAIIDRLVQIESRPIALLRQRQDGLRARVSALGDIIAKLGELKTAADSLAAAGALGTKMTSTHTTFDAVAGSNAAAGRYDVRVTGLAAAAKARSGAFSSPTAEVRAGTLTLDISGTSYVVNVTAGMTLSEVATAVRQSGAPVSATVLTADTSSYLSISNLNTGHAIGSPADSALTITENSTGGTGQALSMAITQTAANATVIVDGLTFTRQSNAVSDVVPGVTMTLKTTSLVSETMVVQNDGDATAKNLQKLVDAYNGVVGLIDRQLRVGQASDRSRALTGDSALAAFKRSMQGLISRAVGTGGIRTLADLGIETAQTGTLSLDRATLDSAITRDAAALNLIFSDATNGIGKATKSLVDGATNTIDGSLVVRKNGLTNSIRGMDDKVTVLEGRVESFRRRMIAQFTAMEKVVSQLRAVGNFLSQHSFDVGGDQ